MKRCWQLRIVIASLLVGGAAVAQHGLIVEPWQQLQPPAAVAARRGSSVHVTMPGSGLPPAERAVPAPAPATHVAETLSAKWTPPVVQLLVDPWAKAPVVAVSSHGRWLPSSTDIIVDPWAAEVRTLAPRAASHAAGAAPSTIF